MKHVVTAAFVLLGTLTSVAHALTIEHATAIATIPGAANSAAFMTLSNPSNSDIRLVKAQSEVGNRIELHTHSNDNGVMRMRQVDQIVVGAGQSVELKPGGLHVMLMQLTQTLSQVSKLKSNWLMTRGPSIRSRPTW